MATKRKQYPSQARLRELFDYDPEGFLVWRYRPEKGANWNGRYAGKKAGTHRMTSSSSVLSFAAQVCIEKSMYNILNIIWIMHRGEVPGEMYVKSRGDLFEGIRIEDLYLSNKKSEMHIGRVSSANKTGYIGVRKRNDGRFTAAGGEAGKKRHIGTYETADAAAAAYNEFARKHYGKGFVQNDTSCNEPEKYRVIEKTVPPKVKQNESGYRGVTRSDHSWLVHGTDVNGETIYLGSFPTKDGAGRAYNIYALEKWGDKAIINDIEDPFDSKGRRFFLPKEKSIGVSIAGKKWRAAIGKIHIGCYEKKEDAQRAYNKKALELKGDKARLNDIPDPLGKLKADEEDVF